MLTPVPTTSQPTARVLAGPTGPFLHVKKWSFFRGTGERDGEGASVDAEEGSYLLPSHPSPSGRELLTHPNSNKSQLVQTSLYHIGETEAQDRKGLG